MLHTVQNSIGSDSLFFGFFSREWYTLQQRYLQVCLLPSNANQADNAINSIIIATLRQVHEIWLLCNAHLHSTDLPRKHLYIHFHLLAKIRELYECAPLVMTADRDIFSYPFDQRQEQSTAALRAYYQWAKPIVERSVQEATELGSNFRRIDSYFPPVFPWKSETLFFRKEGNLCTIHSKHSVVLGRQGCYHLD